MRVWQIVGFKKTGKTTLLVRLTESFASAGNRVGTIKHDGHDFEPDVPGTDSWKHRQAGAAATAVVSSRRTAWFEQRSRELPFLVERMAPEVDLILVEGWKTERYPKLVLIHAEEHIAALSGVPAVAAAVTWNPSLRARLEAAWGRSFDFDDVEAIAKFLTERKEGGGERR